VHAQRADWPEPQGPQMIENILSPTHLLLILVVALIVLGPKRLPEAGRGLGSAIRGFKESLSAPERREEQPVIQPSREDHTLGA
jgi:sec-independent protein translocase protein TatA